RSHLVKPRLDGVRRLPRLLLDHADEPIDLALGPVEVVVGENAPGLLDPALELVPIAVHLEVGHVGHGSPLLRMPFTERLPGEWWRERLKTDVRARPGNRPAAGRPRPDGPASASDRRRAARTGTGRPRIE